MIDLIQQHRHKLEELCRKYQVKTLEVFGSAVNGAWDPESSDLDFLVDFHLQQPGQHAKAYFGLLFDLEDLFQRKIDLLETPAVRNPYFLESINRNRTVLYAA